MNADDNNNIPASGRARRTYPVDYDPPNKLPDRAPLTLLGAQGARAHGRIRARTIRTRTFVLHVHVRTHAPTRAHTHTRARAP
jgi:hypothetical protein